ncbi:NUF2 [Candida pseudojiufengensis]|uniref:NUF2 n=1 Tax=Candida pseudojiufengensis TaxID=497109 RepID=UPI0022241DC5|nr:NUF2 [Candida pseudojiufengensis]KAI5964278.1 NUF2 [Candida pseudojiufengensis]
MSLRRQSTITASSSLRGTRPVRRDAFPYLDNREITSCLLECEFNVSLDAVSKPTSEFIMNLFTLFIESFMGIDNLDEKAKDMAKRRHAIINQQDTEIENEINGNGNSTDEIEVTTTDHLLTLFRFAQKFFQNIGVNDLTLPDLSRPEPLNTRRLLSAVVNYLRFRENISNDFEQMALEAEETTARIRNLQDSNNNKIQQINDLERKLKFKDNGKSNEPRTDLQYVYNYNKKLESKLRELKLLQEQLTKQHDDYKSEKNLLATELYDSGFICDETAGQIENLKAYKEKDIDNLNTIVDDLEQDLDGIVKTYKTFDEQYQNLGKTINSIENNEKIINYLILLSEEILRLVQEEDYENNQVKINNDKLKDLNIESNDLQKQIEFKNEILKKYAKKYQDLDDQYYKKQSSLTLKLREVNENLEEIMSTKSKQNDEHKLKYKIILKIKKETDELINNFIKEVKVNEIKLNQLKNSLQRYMENLKDKIE